MLGANIPAIIRGLIAVAWYGIQTYLASAALDIVLLKLLPGLAPYADVDAVRVRRAVAAGLDQLRHACGCCRPCVFWRGMESIRKFIDFCGPAVYVVMFLLCRLPGLQGRLGEHRPQPRRGVTLHRLGRRCR